MQKYVKGLTVHKWTGLARFPSLNNTGHSPHSHTDARSGHQDLILMPMPSGAICGSVAYPRPL